MVDRSQDFEILDRFQTFSAEIVRLALLGPACVTFFVALAGSNASGETIRQILSNISACLGAGFSLFALAIFSGLAHRYISTDALACIIQRDRAIATADTKKAEELRASVKWRLKASAFLLAVATFCLAAGAATLLWSFLVSLKPL